MQFLRTGQGREKRSDEDIVAMIHKLGDQGPVFAARALRKLPPVRFDSIDVTHLLYRLEKLEPETRSRKEAEDKNCAIISQLEEQVKSIK